MSQQTPTEEIWRMTPTEGIWRMTPTEEIWRMTPTEEIIVDPTEGIMYSDSYNQRRR